MQFEVTKKYDVAPEAVVEIADAMLEWIEYKGWHLQWAATGSEPPGSDEPKGSDGDALSYREMAELFVREREGS